MSMQRSRREFIKTAAYTGIAVWTGTRAWGQDNKSPNDRINFACIGIGGKGGSDTADAARHGNVVAVCDVDERTLTRVALNYPDAKQYTDYRKMLDEMGKHIDAVTVSVPDHSHAPAAAMAMHLGKGVYCQKPLAHSIYEVRRLSEIAREKKVATQMGNQGTADNSMRQNAYRVRAGALGMVKEVHVWTNRAGGWWPQGVTRPEPSPVPSTLHWDLWLGPAKERPYAANTYHDFKWRGWWDFGTGALGDMACHTVNLPFMALDLRNPISVEAESSENNKDSYPKWSQIRYEFAATKTRPAITMWWYDGGRMPSQDLFPPEAYKNGKLADSGSLIIGDKGKLYTPGDYGGGGKIYGGVEMAEVDYPHSPGHWEEYVRAIKSSNPLDKDSRAMSNFPDYAGPLAETILLGNLAVWAGKKVDWDAKHLKAKNAPEVEMIIHPKYRPGYSL